MAKAVKGHKVDHGILGFLSDHVVTLPFMFVLLHQNSFIKPLSDFLPRLRELWRRKGEGMLEGGAREQCVILNLLYDLATLLKNSPRLWLSSHDQANNNCSIDERCWFPGPTLYWGCISVDNSSRHRIKCVWVAPPMIVEVPTPMLICTALIET